MEGLLDKAHKKFKSEASRVKEAQSNLSRAWDDLYVRLTAAYPDVKQRDEAIAGTKCFILGLAITLYSCRG